MVTQFWVNIGAGNALLTDGTKPLLELMLTHHQSSKVFCGIHQRAFSQHMLILLICNMCLEITLWKLLSQLSGTNELTHCGLVTPYGDMELGQHWLRQWLVAWRHQAITWTNVDSSSVRCHGIHLRALSLDDVKIPINKTRLKIAVLKWHPGLPGANELMVA